MDLCEAAPSPLARHSSKCHCPLYPLLTQRLMWMCTFPTVVFTGNLCGVCRDKENTFVATHVAKHLQSVIAV